MGEGGPSPTGAAAVGSEPVSSRPTEVTARDILAIRRAKRGDTSAFAELIRTNDEGVRALVWALTGPDELDALCTTVYLRAFRGLPLAPIRSPRTWLLGIADGTSRDALRRRDRHPGIGETGVPPIPAEWPAEQRLAVAAVRVVGMTPREAGRLVEGGVQRTRELLAAAPGTFELTTTVPEHAPRFWEELGCRLLIEQSQPAATTPRGSGDSVIDTIGTVDLTPPSDVVRGMARRVEQQNPVSFPWRRLGIGAVVLASVAVVIGVAVLLAHRASNRDAGLGETAAKTLDRLDEALAGDTVIRGIATIEAKGSDAPNDGTIEFVRTNTGSWYNRTRDGSTQEGYDVTTSMFTTVRLTGADTGEANVHAGVAPGPPSPTATGDDTLGDLLADSIRVVRGGSGGSVRTDAIPSDDAGTPDTERTVWVVTSRLVPSTDAAPLAGVGILDRVEADEAELVADRSMALPIGITLRRDGRDVVSIEFSDLTISQQKEASPLAPDAPATARIRRTDDGFETTTLAALDTRVDPAPTPAYLPAGYVSSATAVNTKTHTVVVCYRNGSRQLVLTRRPVPDDAPGPSPARGSNDVKISSGALAGRVAVITPGPVDRVEVDDGDTQVVAIGDPGAAELTKVISSLR